MGQSAHVRRARLSTVLSVAGVFLAAPISLGEEPQRFPAPSPRAVEAMRRLESTDPYHRQLGFLQLEALREPSTVETIKRYLDSRDGETRSHSLRALAAIEGAAAVPVLLERLRTDRHPQVRRAALLGLEPLQPTHPEILPAFIKALRDRSTEVRITAVDIVSRIEDPRARKALLLREKRERRRDVRRVLRQRIQS
jgi:HEAT repeat protein